MAKRQISAWLAGIVGLVIALAIGVVLVLPLIVDSQVVKEKVRDLVSNKLGGDVTIEKIVLSWFPWPAVTLHQVGIVVSGDSQGSVETITVHPSIFSLFKGRIVASRITLQRPVVQAHLSDRSQEPLDIHELEERIGAALQSVVANFPLMGVRINDGTVEISHGRKPPIGLRAFNARIRATSAKLTFDISALSNLAARVRLAGEIAVDSLKVETHLSVDQLRLGALIASLAPRSLGYVADGEMAFNLVLESAGLGNFKGEIKGSMPSLAFVRGNRQAVIKAKAFTGRVSGDERTLRLVLANLDLTAPRLSVSGEAAFDRTSATAELQLAGRNLDAQEIRELVKPLVEDIAPVQELFRYLHGGEIAEIRFKSKGRSFAEIIAPRNTAVASRIHDVSLFMPGLDLHLENVAGLITIADGVLESKNLAARHGKMRVHEGKLRLALEKAAAMPLLLDMSVESDAAEAHALLMRLIKDKAYLREASRIRNLQGEIAGRLILEGPVDALVPKVFISKAQLKGSYELLPSPIAVTSGRISYVEGAIRIEDLGAMVGRSSVAKLTGSLTLAAMPKLAIESGSLDVDVEQIHSWLGRFANLATRLDSIKFPRGRLEFASLSLSGPLNDPSLWQFRGAGQVEGLVMAHAALPGPIRLARGSFDGTAERLSFDDVRVDLLDSSLEVAGFLQNPIKGPLRGEASAGGLIQSRMIDWLRRNGELPEQLTPRAPLRIDAARLAWSNDGQISVRGQFSVPDGPSVYLDASRAPHGLNVKEIIIEHARQRARMAFEAAGGQMEISFAGMLEAKTLSGLFVVPPVRDGAVQGDMVARYALSAPLRFSAVGNLQGSNVVLELGDVPLVFHKISIASDKERLLIRSAKLQLDKSQFSLSGLLQAASDGLGFDLDVAADRLRWEEIDRFIKHAAGSRQEESKVETRLPPIRGALRLRAEEFIYGNYSSRPLHINAELSQRGLKGEVEQSVVCGIQAQGKFDVQNDSVALDLQFSETDGQLERTSRCLTAAQIQGSYSLKAVLKGAGDHDSFARSVTGSVAFVARDGRFVRSSGVDATFDYLNATGDFDMIFPDLDRESFPFRLFSVKGTLDGSIFSAEDVAIDAASLTLTGAGTIDLSAKRIDAKGLVSVSAPGRQLLGKVPILGSVLGGSLLGIPVRLSGSLDRPDVSYLAAKDVGEHLLNMPVRLLGLPLEALRVFTPDSVMPNQQ